MRSFSALLLSALLVLAFSQNCQNPLLAAFNFTGLPDPVSGAGLPYCNYLKGAQTCCSADTVATFQASADALAQRLQAYAAERDQNIVLLGSSYIDQFRDAFSDLTDHKSDADRIQDDIPAVGNEIEGQYTLFSDIKDELDKIDNDDFNEDVRDYQRKRVACFTTILRVQTSAWCLACDPNYQVAGVSSNGSVAFSDGLCGVISASCAPFVAAGDKLSPVFRAEQGFLRMVNLTNYLNDYSDNDNTLPNYIIDGFALQTNATQQTNTVPPGCDGDNCPWQCQNLFSPSVQVNEVVVGNGAGLIGGSDLNLLPIGQVAVPVGTTPVVPVTPVTPPANETAPPVNETVLPVNETVLPVNETVLPVNETILPVNETALPVNETVILVNETALPVNATAPVDTTIPINATQPVIVPPTTWAPNLTDSGITFSLLADPGAVSGVQGDGSGESDTDGNPSDTDDLNTP